jgi:hypothetical protein
VELARQGAQEPGKAGRVLVEGIYMKKRLHSSLEYLLPVEFEAEYALKARGWLWALSGKWGSYQGPRSVRNNSKDAAR